MLSGLRWRKLLFNLSIWLTAEIALTLLGLDNIADYAEFIIQSDVTVSFDNAVVTLPTVV